MLEGICVRGRDKRTLTLPSSDKTTRTQVRGTLDRHMQAPREDVHAAERALSPSSEYDSGYGVVQALHAHIHRVTPVERGNRYHTDCEYTARLDSGMSYEHPNELMFSAEVICIIDYSPFVGTAP